MAFAASVLAQPKPAPPRTPSAERPILLVDQIRSGPLPKELTPVIQQIRTMNEIEGVLRANGIKFRRGRAQLDTRTVSRELVRAISTLPPGEIFVIPQGAELTFSVVIAALTPDAAAQLKAQPQQPPPQAAPR